MPKKGVVQRGWLRLAALCTLWCMYTFAAAHQRDICCSPPKVILDPFCLGSMRLSDPDPVMMVLPDSSYAIVLPDWSHTVRGIDSVFNSLRAPYTSRDCRKGRDSRSIEFVAFIVFCTSRISVCLPCVELSKAVVARSESSSSSSSDIPRWFSPCRPQRPLALQLEQQA